MKSSSSGRRTRRSTPMPAPQEVSATVVRYSHLSQSGVLTATLEGKVCQLIVNAEHLRKAGFDTLTRKQSLTVRIGWLVRGQPRVEEIVLPKPQTGPSPVTWIMKS